jgi:hypothetical protein
MNCIKFKTRKEVRNPDGTCDVVTYVVRVAHRKAVDSFGWNTIEDRREVYRQRFVRKSWGPFAWWSEG